MNKRDLSISMREATFKSLVIAGPIAIFQAFVFFAWHDLPNLSEAPNLPLFAFLLVIGIFLHELIHLFAWAAFARKPLYAFKLGFQWAALTPYAHSKEPMDIFPYRIGAAAPGLLLGIIPWLISLFIGNLLLFFFGLAYTSAAGGDFLILWLLRHVKPNTLVEDHPSNAGCFVYEQ
jgi:hypothetical protein